MKISNAASIEYVELTVSGKLLAWMRPIPSVYMLMWRFAFSTFVPGLQGSAETDERMKVQGVRSAAIAVQYLISVTRNFGKAAFKSTLSCGAQFTVNNSSKKPPILRFRSTKWISKIQWRDRPFSSVERIRRSLFG